MVDIFEKGKETVTPEWTKFVNAGDSVQGTYVGKIVGQKDGFGNEQIIYQLLQDNGKVTNIGMSLGKKTLNQDMENVKFGQIIGFKYKGIATFYDKRTKKEGKAKDFSLFQDPKIVNDVWLKENKDNMPEIIKAITASFNQNTDDNEKSLDEFVSDLKSTDTDIPFSSEKSLTNEDKLLVIEKLAKEKLEATTAKEIKEKVMESTGIAFIPVNYQKIIDALAAI